MNAYELRGRKVLIQFECGRCGKKHIEPYAKQAEKAEGNLQCFQPPAGWFTDSFVLPMLCADCHRMLKEFLTGGANNAE